MEPTNYEFEVAFSFLHEDEKLAFEINDLIQDRFKTFIYTEQQKILAGRDGEKTFNQVFAEKSRLVVVLFRENWGHTKWTRIEETAIRNRAHEDGYDFTIFVQLDPSSKMPKWLPKTRIYYDVNKFDPKGLSPVITFKIQELGGINRPETIEDQKARMRRAYELEQERLAYLNSPDAYQDAQIEFNKLFNLFNEKATSLEDNEIGLTFGYTRNINKELVIRFGKYCLHLKWHYAYSNTLKDAFLEVYTATHINFDEKHKLDKYAKYSFNFNPVTSEKGWRRENKAKEFFMSEQIMLEWISSFLKNIDLKVGLGNNLVS